jgi:hypothetical protein
MGCNSQREESLSGVRATEECGCVAVNEKKPKEGRSSGVHSREELSRADAYDSWEC